MEQLVLMGLHRPGWEEPSSLRVDHISEIHPRRSNATPYKIIGSTVHLVTGREVDVIETPEKIAAQLAWIDRKLHGLDVPDPIVMGPKQD